MSGPGRFDVTLEGRVAVHIQGETAEAWAAPRTVMGNPGARMPLVGTTRGANADGEWIELLYRDEPTGLEVVNRIQFFGDNPISRRQVTVTNRSAAPWGLDLLHSAFIGGIPWPDDRRYRIHVPHNDNYAENQWRASPLSALGLVRSRKGNVTHLIVNSIGRSCQSYVPMAILENTEERWCLIWQIEHSGSWMWDLGQGFGDVLSLGIGGLSETWNHWYKRLAPDESITGLPVAVGRVEGGPDDALAALAVYRRAACVVPHPVDCRLPVIFNDYMHCLNGDPDEGRSLRLITKAAAAGCEVYVIDAGWFGVTGWGEIGNWHESPNKFPRGLKHVMDAVRAGGMIPGLWIEIEAASSEVELARQPDDWFLSLHGRRNLWSKRLALDFRNPAVRRFADETLERLIGDYGLGYIKFDYNLSIQLGTDFRADSPGDGALEHTRAVQDWFRGLRRRHPGVILESCASGGMRTDYGLLSILQLASSSDQSDYHLTPAIAVGGMASVLPEQLAVWSYPKAGEDREAAVFNMVNAMLCRIHQSGPIADISSEQFAVIREGINLYRQSLRQAIPYSTPFWPLGRPAIEHQDVFTAVGLTDRRSGSAWLAVWRLDTRESAVDIALEHLHSGKVKIEQLFPREPARAFSFGRSTLHVNFPAPYTAAIFRIETER
jgi:alpha-galactosidase